MSRTNTSGRLVPKRLTVVLGLSSVGVTVLTAVLLGGQLRSPEQAAADAAPPPASPITVAAEQRALVEPVVLRGKVEEGPSFKLLPPPGATGDTAVVSKVPVKVGSLLAEGKVVAEVSGRPVVALALRFPLWRDLVGGMEGPDVTEVQRALTRLGHRVRLSGVFDSATQRALRSFLQSRGYDAIPPSPDAAKQVQQAQDAVTAAQLDYDAAMAAATGVEQAKARLDEAKRTLVAVKLSAGPSLPRTVVARIDKSGRKVTAVHVKVGSTLANAESPMVELDGAAAFVTSTATAEQARLIMIGQSASIFDEVSGAESDAIVATVDGADGNVASGIEVRLTFVGQPLAAAADRSVRIDLAAGVDAAAVLAVPVTAVYARSDGSHFATVMDSSGAAHDVTVETGQIAGGWVQVTPADPSALAAGTLVVVGSHDVSAKATG